MFLRSVALLVCLLTLGTASAQKRTATAYSKEIRIVSDNDNYLLSRKDGYYTNGLLLQVHWTGRGARRRLHTVEAGQKMFTSRSRLMRSLEEYDRPFTGYLYARYQQTRFLRRDGLWQWGVAAGTIGKASLAEQVQTSYHQLIGIYRVYGWDVQLRSAFGADAHVLYAPLTAGTSWFSVKPLLGAQLGTTFTHAQAGAVLQLGWFEKNRHSALWQARLGAGDEPRRRDFELFASFQPQVSVHAYNATVQGGLFNRDKGPFTAPIHRLFYTHRIGLLYARGHISAGIDVVYQTREAKTQTAVQRYGSFNLAYRFN